MSDDEKNPHNNLYYYGGMLLLGVIVLILGLQQLNWIISLVGGLLAAFGGFEVKINYTKIQNEENTIRAKQNGHHNTQVNQTSPVNSPTIGKIQHAYFGSTPASQSAKEPKSKREESRKESEDDAPETESICSGRIHFDDYEDFEVEVSRGDKVKGRVEANYPVSVQIMNNNDFGLFNPGDDDNDVYWKSPKTTSFDFSWTAKKHEEVHVLVVNETDESDWGDEQPSASANIDVIRKTQD